MEEDRRRALSFCIDELRQAAVWKETFCLQQQDKARFFITLLSTEMFVVGLSLNTVPSQKYLQTPCALSFLVCFAAAFWSMFNFGRAIEPRYFHARDEGATAHHLEGEEALMMAAETQAAAQNKSMETIVDLQAGFLRRGVRSFVAFNCIFAAALIVSRLAWFLPN